MSLSSCTCTCALLNAVGQNVFPKSIVCGVVPLFDDEGWKLVNLSVCRHRGVHHLLKAAEECVTPYVGVRT